MNQHLNSEHHGGSVRTLSGRDELGINDTHLAIRDGHLFVDDCDAVELARDYGTPLFVVSEGQLRNRIQEFQRAFGAAWPEGAVRILPSIKANYCFALRRILSQEGAGCDTFGEGELRAALTCGVAPELISVNGSVKTRRLLQQAIEAGARITLDSVSEFDRLEDLARELGKVAAIRFRVRPRFAALDMISQLSAEPTTVREAAQRYKPGLPEADLLAVAPRAAASPHVDFRGLHYHVGRHRYEVNFWRLAICSFADVVAKVHTLLGGWLPREIDVGGGFAPYRDPVARAWSQVPQTVDEEVPTIREYAQAVGSALREEFRQRGIVTDAVTLEVEPGRAVYTNAGIHLSSVCNVKRESEPTRHCWVETDTSEAFLSDLFVEGWRWPVLVANRADESRTLVADVVGQSCGFDLLVPDALLPASVTPGDTIALLDTGAYDEPSASNFNAMPRPATVLVCRNQAEIVKRRETYDDVFRREVIPQRLR